MLTEKQVKTIEQFVKLHREFTGHLKTKPIQQGDTIKYAYETDNGFEIRTGVLDEMWKPCEGGSWHTFELLGEPTNISVSIERILAVIPKAQK